MKIFPEKKMEETLKDNRTHSGEPPGVTDKSQQTPSPGSPGMRILSTYSMTINNLMKVVGVE
ncbi:MAG: hypothetical protein L7F78_27095 [Syntrophales bacterium LBB04]|nr:hypothetical protein [Syntrophales bacterium LBB04]